MFSRLGEKRSLSHSVNGREGERATGQIVSAWSTATVCLTHSAWELEGRNRASESPTTSDSRSSGRVSGLQWRERTAAAAPRSAFDLNSPFFRCSSFTLALSVIFTSYYFVGSLTHSLTFPDPHSRGALVPELGIQAKPRLGTH